jgi:MATE family multidrug resistance protein
MKIIISINLLNVILDYLFVYIFSMNIEGVAYASLIAESSIVFFIINHLFHDRRFINKNIFLSSLNNLSKLKNKLIVNGNMFIRSIILMTCFAHFMSLSASYGEIILAANTILLNFFFIFSYGIDAFAHSTEVMVGNAVGEKNIDKYDLSIHSSFKLTLTIAMLFLLFFLIFSNNIIYTITSHINVIESVEENIIFLFMVVMFGSIAFCIDGILIGGLQHIIMRNVMIISGIIYFLSVYLLELNLSSTIWYPFILFFITRSLLLISSLSHIRRALFN